MEPVAERGRRALVLMAVAATAAVVAVAVYLWPAPTPAGAPVPAPRPSGQAWHLAAASFGDALHGAVALAAGDRFAPFLTSDGGRTWRPLPDGGTGPADPGVTTFLDRDHAVSVDLGPAGRLAVSDDGGRTWATVPQPVAPAGGPLAVRQGGVLGGPFFLDAADGWWFGPRPGTAGAAGPTLWRTADGGRSWVDLAPAGLPPDAGPSPPRPVFVDRLRGAMAVGPIGPDPWPSLLATRDGGRTWAPAAPAWPLAQPPARQGMLVAPTLLAHGDRLVLTLDLAVDRSSGPSPLLRHLVSSSADGGLTWAPWSTIPSTITATAAMAFDDAGTLLLADGGRLLASSDQGRTWRSRPAPGLGGKLWAVTSARGGAVFAIELGGPVGASTLTLLRSVDAGISWTEVPLPGAPAP